MLSAIIATRNNEATLGGALADLVSAAVGGLVREVVVVDAGSTDATLEIADDAGAVILSATGTLGERLSAGCAAAKSAWLLVLPPTPMLVPGWERPLAAQIEGGSDTACPLAATGGLAWARPAPEGLLVSRLRYDRAGGFRPGEQPMAELLRRLGSPRRTLKIALSGRDARR